MTGYISITSAEKVLEVKESIAAKYEDRPRETLATSTELPKSSSISMLNISNLKGWRANNTFDEERSSLKNTSVIFKQLDIQLDSDPEKAGAQIYELLESDERRAHEKILGVLHLPEPSMDQKLELLTKALVKYDKHASADRQLQESFLNALAELSLFPKSHPLLCRVYKYLSGKNKLVKEIFALHVDRKLVSSLYSFISTDVKEQQPDDTLFRGESSLSAPLSGLFVRHYLESTLKAFLTKKFVVKKFDPMKAKQYASFFEKRALELLKELEKSPRLLEAVRKARIVPIREHFKDEKNLETLTHAGVVDMLFLRGVCPFISTCERVEPTLRIAFAQFLINLVNGIEYEQPELQPLNESLRKLTPVAEEFFRIL